MYLDSCSSAHCPYHSLKVPDPSLPRVRTSNGGQNLRGHSQLLRGEAVLSQLFWEEVTGANLHLLFECVARDLYHLFQGEEGEM